jgi:DNA-binding NtrC family response regulator
MIQVLVLDDESGIRAELSEFLTGRDFTVFEASSPSEAFSVLSHNPVDITILDIRLPEMSGIEVLREIRHSYPGIANIMMSGHGDMDTVIDALRMGAVDFFRKPFHLHELYDTIERACTHLNFAKSINGDHCNLMIQTSFEEDESTGLLTVSPRMKKVVEKMRLVARSENTTVLVTGESGTGKELIARGIHHISNRRNNVFHAVNCSSIPDELFESEFFGYEKGAFTGATINKPGWFELANKGTLFLDEISDMKPTLQAKLLRIMEDRKIARLGATKTIPIDVRIIAATNQDLESLVQKGLFREDLFHRLNIFTIDIPPLQQRREAIPLLFAHFMEYYCNKLGMKQPRVQNEVMEAVLRYDFPGNVRELKHMVERALILCEGDLLTFHHFDHLEMKLRKAARLETSNGDTKPLNILEKESILQALQQTHNNKSRAARMLNISRQALDRRLQKYGIEIP